MKAIPAQIRGNELSKFLDQIRADYAKLSSVGRIEGLVIADQDAKVLAVNTFFDTKMNYWDIGAIGAALYGVAKQGKDFFQAEDIDRTAMIYKNRQFFVQTIGSIVMPNQRKRELILIVLGDKQLNIGLVMMQMMKPAPHIKSHVEQDVQIQSTMQMSETEFMKHLGDVKKELFELAK